MLPAASDYNFFYQTPIGWLAGLVQNHSIVNMVWLREKPTAPSCNQANKQVSAVIAALDDYFASGVIDVALPLYQHGTPFQCRVWDALRRTRRGTVKTYGELAKELNTSSRAVGQACRRNAIVLFIPCHRVVAANGLGGFMGGHRQAHTEIKHWLLQHEGAL